MAKRRKKTAAQPRELTTSGALCLAFANSAAPDRDDRRVVPRLAEPFDGYADLVVWSQRMGALTANEAERLVAAGEKLTEEATALARRARELRLALQRIFTAEAAGKRPRGADLKTLNAALGQALATRRLVAAPRGCDWTWEDADVALGRALWPVALSAAELLTSEDVGRIRRCADRKCPRLFVDRGRSQRRLWCDMRACGNRAKSRRYYRRYRSTYTPSSGLGASDPWIMEQRLDGADT